MKTTQPRTLESFAKADLIALIRKRFWRIDESIRDLRFIEERRMLNEIETKQVAIEEELTTLTLPQDLDRYKTLSRKWDQLAAKGSRLFNERRGA